MKFVVLVLVAAAAAAVRGHSHRRRHRYRSWVGGDEGGGETFYSSSPLKSPSRHLRAFASSSSSSSSSLSFPPALPIASNPDMLGGFIKPDKCQPRYTKDCFPNFRKLVFLKLFLVYRYLAYRKQLIIVF